ncbi:hypothetical protein GCM10010279_70480 [Streptomyces mutabilis]|nr:hypothetical protein GCM10010279_70480 [Streptomyces mutabilis]
MKLDDVFLSTRHANPNKETHVLVLVYMARALTSSGWRRWDE